MDGRASLPGVAEQVRRSPWRFKDLASSFIPTNREKVFTYAIMNNLALLLLLIFVGTLYGIFVMLMPFFRPLLLALLFGSFLHPMKRSLKLFFKRILKEICEDDVPIIAALTMPFKMFDRAIDHWPIQLLNHIKSLASFVVTIMHGDVSSAVSIAMASISLSLIGGDSLMKFVIFLNLISLIRDTSQTSIGYSDLYLYFLIRSFVLVQICWLHSHILYLLLPIIIILKLMLLLFRKLCIYFREKISQNLSLLESSTRGDDNEHPEEETPVAPADESIGNPMSKVFQYVVEQIDGSLDTVSSLSVIAIMGSIVIFATLFLSFHVYSESAYIMERVSITANNIIEKNPDLKALLPGNYTGVHSLLDGAVKNTYEHGREWIRKSTRQLLSNAALDEFNSTLIEKQMIEFWDRAYSLYTNSSLHNHDIQELGFRNGSKPYDWDRLFHALQSLNFTLCAQIFKQNWDTLVSVSESISKLLKANLSLATSLMTAAISIVIISGNALLNFMHFIMLSIIFTTSLFYLLSASQEQYIPIQLVQSLISNNNHSDNASSNNKEHTKLGDFVKNRTRKGSYEIFDSVDESINAVFTVSLKMMAFHGLSTWLLHTLFELEVVYIPSVISALFGAVPFIAPYWASVPACFDLWLSGQKTQSILMLLIATIPSSFVSTAFYSEIKSNGHPYMTALAVAGGSFFFGIEGALFGPMLLVFIHLLYIIVKRYL